MKRFLLVICCMVLTLISYAYDFEVDGVKYNILSREKLTVSVARDNNTCSGDIVIPSTVTYGAYTFNVTEISDYFLFNNYNVSSITIQEGVKKIGNCAIFNQSYREIDYISYPNSLDTLVGQAVGGCYNPRKIYIKDIKHWCEDVVLTSPYYSHPLGRGYLDTYGDNYGFLYIDGILNRNLLIPNSVDHINDGIFNESNIDTLTISSSVKKIGYLAFGESTVKCVKFSIGLDSIDSRAFYNTRLNDIILPDGLKFIGESAFRDCKNTQYIQINNEISEIEQSAFQGCSSAQKLVLGNGIKKIKSNAFADCGQFQSVVSKSLTPPDIEANTFSSGTYLFATLYVPKGTKPLYEAATGWKEFSNIRDADMYYLTYVVDNEVYKSYEIEEGGTITPEPEPTKEGYTFSGWSEIPETMPAHDVTITGTFTKIVLGKCATPTIAIKDGKLTFSCETEGVKFIYDILANGSTSGEGNVLDLTPSYVVKVYATKDGYEDSDVATETINIIKGDVDGDGVIDIADAVRIVNFIVGKIPALAPRSEMNMADPE